jgi:uncharacterized low-complexity protein
MKKTKQSPLLLAMGTTLVSGLSITAVQAENANPFVMTELSDGYLQLAKADTKDEKTTKKEEKGSGKMKTGACGEGKCGGKTMKGGEEKTAEGNCAGNKPIPKTDKASEGKCGEGKCGEGTCGDKKPS